MKKFKLDMIPVLEYLKFSLEDTNALSSTLMRSIDFELGGFFTFLPEDTKADEVYKFRNGRIAKNISDELPFILLNILQENTELNCIIDDFNSTYTLDYKDRRETYPTRPC